MEIFPLKQQVSWLEEKDFILFGTEFVDTVLELVPTAQTVFFPENAESLLRFAKNHPQRATLLETHKKALQTKKWANVVDDLLVLYFPLAHGNRQIAVIQGIDPIVLQRYSQDWLDDVHAEILARFLTIKKSYVDWETGLPNMVYFSRCIQAAGVDSDIAELILVELPPRRNNARECFRHVQKSAWALTSFCSKQTVICHLGQCIFALFSPSPQLEFSRRFCSLLVRFLQNEGFPQVHIGMSVQPAEVADESLKHTHDYPILHEAWTALQIASKRGRFSFCEFSSQNGGKNDEMPSKRSIQRLLGKVTNSKQFAVLNIASSSCSPDILYGHLTAVCAEKQIVLDHGQLFLVCSNCSEKEAEKMATDIFSHYQIQAPEIEINIGISIFPFRSYRKSQVIRSSHAALQHALLLGPNRYAIYDAVSCNISGDNLFSDGDLPAAIEEYRMGLELEPDNINLLNSLGVAYALLDRGSDARLCFERVLQLAENDHMAAYNLGLIAKNKNSTKQAITYFEKAWQSCSDVEENRQIILDLNLQLGKLYCADGQFLNALQCLEFWYAKSSDGTKKQRTLRYLGEAQYGCGQSKKAMTTLQQAINIDSFDSQSLSLLGKIILEDKEGDDIALSLCQKSVEMDPSSHLLLFRLAQVELHCGQIDAALRHCRRLQNIKKFQPAVFSLLADIYATQNNRKQSQFWQEKATACKSIETT